MEKTFDSCSVEGRTLGAAGKRRALKGDAGFVSCFEPKGRLNLSGASEYEKVRLETTTKYQKATQ